jgi:hypothetical protein
MSASLREQVRRRGRLRCEYCQMPEELDALAFHWDHIIVQKRHGQTALQNLAWSCYGCNNQKQSDIAGIDPKGEADAIVRLFRPRTDNWNEHFEWGGPELIAKTPIGRVTLYVLGIKLPHRVNLRQLLISEGVFPPT